MFHGAREASVAMDCNAKVFKYLNTLYGLSLIYEGWAFSAPRFKDNNLCFADIHIETTISTKFGKDT